MNGILILTISGKDRAGLVENLADVIVAHGGNWEQCRMAHLAGRFVGILEVTVPGDQQQELESALRTIRGLDVMIAAGQAAPATAAATRAFDLEVVGSDHPGIVRDVFKALAAEGINVEELTTRTYSAPDSGGQLFEAKARLACRADFDWEPIRDRLEQIAQDVMVDLTLKDDL
jgi:glycine cleavage system regulatory protein